MLADLPLADLRGYRPDVAEPADFDRFWTDQLAAARGHRAEPAFTLTDSPVRHAEVYDVTFPGHGGNPISGWLLAPRAEVPGAAVVVEFIGYGGGRGDPFDWLGWGAPRAGAPGLGTPGPGGGGGGRGRRVHRVRRRPRAPVRLAALERRRARAPGHGHPRPGRRLAQRGHAGSG